MTRLSLLLALFLAVAMLFLTGCGGGYVVRGRVVDGGFSGASFVDATDERLADRGIPNVRIGFIRNPDSLGRQEVASGISDPQGNFSIPISDFGAGWMVEQWQMTATRNGFARGEARLTLPSASSDQRLLIFMAEGADTLGQEEDLMQQFDRFR